MGTTEIGRPVARLVLPGSGTVDASVEVIYQSRATRASRALLTLGVAFVIMPVLFFIPPHFLWPLLSLVIGGYLAWRYWRGEYYLIGFEGKCPRCDTALDVARGTRVRRRHTLECYSCHRHPELVIDDLVEDGSVN